MHVGKVFITGGPASGKTTLSQRLAGALNAPGYELDRLYLEHNAPGTSFEANFKAEVARIIATDAWVAEGSYLGWSEPLLREAGAVIWMDVPWRCSIVPYPLPPYESDHRKEQPIPRLPAAMSVLALER